MKKYKNLDEISEKEMLKFIFATQMQILRKIEMLNTIEISDPNENIVENIRKISSTIERINEELSK